MRNALTLIVAATFAVALGACSRTDDGRVVIERPGDVTVHTTKDTLGAPHVPSVHVGTEKDTINVPVITTEKKVVNKPVITSH
jgi:hypothetical protein